MSQPGPKGFCTAERKRRKPVPLRIMMFASLLIGMTGCMALDELDSANSKMATRAKGKAAAAPPEAASAAATVQAKANPVLEKSKQWWDRATSLSPAETKSSVVRCRLPNSTQFMERDDCLSRGGGVSGVSG